MKAKQLGMAAVLLLLTVFLAAGCGMKSDDKGTTNGAETHQSAEDKNESDKNDGQTEEKETDDGGLLEDAGDDMKDALDDMETDASRRMNEAEE